MRESIIVLGASGVGKTTLMSGAREAEYYSDVRFPLRYTTRLPRLNDQPFENAYVNKVEFDILRLQGKLYPTWQKPLPGAMVSYGYESLAEGDMRLPVYLAGPTFPQSDSAQHALDSGLLVIKHVEDVVRIERLRRRSPDLSEEEIALRAERFDTSGLINRYGAVVIDATKKTADEVQFEFNLIVKDVLNGSL